MVELLRLKAETHLLAKAEKSNHAAVCRFAMTF